jgi:uncharacterized protein YcbX
VSRLTNDVDGQDPVRLTRIRVYPLKGAAGFDLDETELDETGIPGDRRWMLTDPRGGFISQRTHPRLCLIQSAPAGPTSGDPNEVGAGSSFTLEAPGMEPFLLQPVESEAWSQVRLHEDSVSVMSGYEEADRWFSAFLEEPCHLVFMPMEVHRPVDPEWAPGFRVGLADGYPLHLTSEESLREMNLKLSHETSMLRYRPNLVVAGGRPWDEDEWRTLDVGGVRLRLVKPCARCTVTTVDQATGARGQEPLRGMSSSRMWKGKVYFGQNAVADGNGRFRVGDRVHIVERGIRRPPLPG